MTHMMIYLVLSIITGNILSSVFSNVFIILQLRKYPLTDSIMMYDTMGYEEGSAVTGPSMQEIELILDGHIKDGHEVK